MKKRITAIIMAAAVLASGSVFAATLSLEAHDAKRAVIMCYDADGTLVYSDLCKAENGSFDVDIPEQYSDCKKTMYVFDTQSFVDINELEVTPPPAATAAPAETQKPAATEKPSATEKPAATPGISTGYPSIYEKALDAIYAPAVVDEVELTTDSDDEEIYAVKALMYGKELTIPVEKDLPIRSAPEANKSLVGQNADALEKGDVISVTTNIAGDRVKTLDLVFRPTVEDIITGSADYGASFEKLFSANGKVAGQWTAMKYAQKASSDRYQYAFGVVGKRSGSALTLINKDADIDEAIEVTMQSDTIVYLCDVDGKEYNLEIGGINDIASTVPANSLNKGSLVLDDNYSYNYALVRVVDGVATDIVVYENYNN